MFAKPHLEYFPKNFQMPAGFRFFNYLEKALMHLAQILILFPANSLYLALVVPTGIDIHWRFGYFLFLPVGLYFPLNFSRFPTIRELFSQIIHVLVINSFQHLNVLVCFSMLTRILLFYNSQKRPSVQS